MGVEQEVMRIQDRLAKIGSDGKEEQVMDLLRTLQRLPLNLAVLTDTKIGITINNIRKTSTNKEISSLSKKLIKKWKKYLSCIGKENHSNGTDHPTTPSVKIEEVPKQPEKEAKKKFGPILQTSFPARDPNEDIRRKCREMLLAALIPENPAEALEKGALIHKLATELEECVFQEFQNTSIRYKNKIRSRVLNLKDPKNPQLKANYLAGVLSAAKLATMTTEEMASDEMKKLRLKLERESFDETQLAAAQGTYTELLKCSKCKKNNCTYNQVQTRSADEPMTTFVLCNECGYRWRF